LEYRYVHIKPTAKPLKNEEEILRGSTCIVNFGDDQKTTINGENTMRLVDDYLQHSDTKIMNHTSEEAAVKSLLSTFAPIILTSHGAAPSE
jgi:hypothetical protein